MPLNVVGRAFWHIPLPSSHDYIKRNAWQCDRRVSVHKAKGELNCSRENFMYRFGDPKLLKGTVS